MSRGIVIIALCRSRATPRSITIIVRRGHSTDVSIHSSHFSCVANKICGCGDIMVYTVVRKHFEDGNEMFFQYMVVFPFAIFFYFYCFIFVVFLYITV